MNILVHKIDQPLVGKIKLAGSKSISNRVLIIKALCENDFNLSGLANADDTQVLQHALESTGEVVDVHHAGTSYRFLTSYLCLQSGEQILTGSDRMKERPIGPLVDALRILGANIEYLDKQGYPALKIGESDWKKLDEPLKIDATISSQFISSLLLVAPCLPYGLHLELVGDLVSRPYLEMTLSLMNKFGIGYSWEGNLIEIEPQKYEAHDFIVEADWSAASYYFMLVSAIPDSEIQLEGLSDDSVQGDSKIVDMMKPLGVDADYSDGLWTLKHSGKVDSHFEYDFLLQPDLAQTIAVSCAIHGVTGVYSGLQTLKVKETDRIEALQNELVKGQLYFVKLPSKFSKKENKEYYMQEGKFTSEDMVRFPTYKDHRMAMAFTGIASIVEVLIENADVVSKSYPDFWEDMEKIGLRWEIYE